MLYLIITNKPVLHIRQFEMCLFSAYSCLFLAYFLPIPAYFCLFTAYFLPLLFPVESK